MACRHAAGDQNCSSSPAGQARELAYRQEQARATATRRQKELEDNTPDPDKYEILLIEQVGPHLAVYAKYTSCVKCSFEGKKTMVFLNTSYKEAVFWRRIDPHFRAPSNKSTEISKEAPSPAARFPGTPEGWQDALNYAKTKSTSR